MQTAPFVILPDSSDNLRIQIHSSTLNTGGYTDVETPEVLVNEYLTDQKGRIERVLYFDGSKKGRINGRVDYFYPEENKIFIVEADKDSIPLYSWTLVDSSYTEVEKYENGELKYKWVFETGDSLYESSKKYEYWNGKNLVREEKIQRDSVDHVISTCLFQDGQLQGMNYYFFDEDFDNIEEIHAFPKSKINKAAKRLGVEINSLCGTDPLRFQEALKDKISKYSYNYDDRGNRVQWFEFKPNGELDYEGRATYDKADDLLEEKYILSSSQVRKSVYSYTEDGEIAEKKQYRNDKLMLETDYLYDDRNRVEEITITNYSGYTRVIMKLSWTYSLRE